MYIAIGNSIGSSSNSGGTPVPPPPEFTRYLIQDCISGNEYNSLIYDWGQFQINDRVECQNDDNQLTFGKVIGYTEGNLGERSINYLGVNSANCYDNTLLFTSEISNVDTVIFVKFYCKPLLGDFVYNGDIDTQLNYDYNFDINYQGFNDEGNPVNDTFNVTGQIQLSPYNFIQNEDNYFGQHVENTGDTITNLSLVSPNNQQPSFVSTTSFSDNSNCSYNYFLQNTTGYSFNAGFPTEC